jgi:hypothetical protein
MPDALTRSQVHVLRRVRDGKLWSADSPLENELGEAMVLAALGLPRYVQIGIFDLTALGRQYLAGIEGSTPDISLPDPPRRDGDEIGPGRPQSPGGSSMPFNN